MSFTCGFYNALDHDRLYDALQMSSIFDGIIRDGVFMIEGNQFMVNALDGMTVTVDTGRAWFDHTWNLNDSKYPITLDQSEVVLDRIDAVIIEVNADEAVRENFLKVVKGTPSTDPVRPTLEDSEYLHQHALAYIYVAANVSLIRQSNITYVVGTEETPYVTAPLEIISIDNIVAQWAGEWNEFRENWTVWGQDFQDWFDNLVYVLDGDVAGHLQNEIDAIQEAKLTEIHALFGS